MTLFKSHCPSRRARLRIALCAVVLCHALQACALPQDQEEPEDASPAATAAASAAEAAEPAPATMGAAADSSVLESDCDAKFCVASASKLADYCELEHARCPGDGAAAKTLACGNRFARERQAFVSSCGGNSVRILYDHGVLDYHYDAAGALRTVTTIIQGGNETCNTDAVVYGDENCQAGATVALACP